MPTPVPSVRVLWRPEQFNRVTNPGFETNTSGWSVSAGINAAGTSITRITTDSHSGSACASLVCGSSDGGGVNFDMGSDRYWNEPTYGTMYAATVWLKRVSGSTRARIILGSEGTSSDRATLSIRDLPDTWTPYRIVWLPAGNRTDVQLAITNGSASALTVRVDDVAVYMVDAFSQLENGSFVSATTGWDTGAGVFAVAATSLTRSTSDGFAPSQQTCAELVTTSTTLSGADYSLADRTFVAGRSYQFRVALKRVSGASTARIRIGSVGSPSESATATVTLTTGWAWYGVDFTPTVDLTDVAVSVMNGSAAVLTVRICHAEVYEAVDDLGTDAGSESESTHVEGVRWSRATDAIGSIVVRVRDDDGLYHPRNASGALYGSLEPGRRIWGRATYGGALYPLFWGTLRTIEAPPVGSIHTDLVAEDAMGLLANGTVSRAMSETTYAEARAAAIAALLSGDPATLLSVGTSRLALSSAAIESGSFFDGTDGEVGVLDYLADINEATQSVHYCKPSVRANVGWLYTTVDRVTLSDDSSDFTVDEDFEDLTGIRSTDEALENRQEVPWQSYSLLPPPDDDGTGMGTVMVARDPTIYPTEVDGEDPWLHYTNPEYGTTDDHPDPRWRYPAHLTRREWRKRKNRGRRVKNRVRVYNDAFVPVNSGPVDLRYIFDFAVPVADVTILVYFSTAIIVGLPIDYLETRPDRVEVELHGAIPFDKLAVLGRPYLPGDDVSVIRVDHESQALRGVHPGPGFSTPYIISEGAAQGVGDYRNWRYRAPRLRPVLVDHMTGSQGPVRTLTAEVTDHLTVSADRWRVDAVLFVSQACEWEIAHGALEMRSWHRLEELPTGNNWFTLDVSDLDDTDVLAY